MMHRRNNLMPLFLAGLLLLPMTLPGSAAGAPSAPGHGMELQTAWVPMPDGLRLAADLYLPTGGKPREKFPVLLEYLPYRKDESRDRNYAMYAYFVERGYVVARVDIRGTGNSEGRLVPYEYSDQEWADGNAVIDWLAAQPWSSGAVGMFGISWGGFNAIQMAGRGHPALKAIIAVDATEDLYQEDVHYIDGIMHLDSWEMSQELYNAMPGAPDYVIDDALFENRFDTEPWVLSHKRQQRDGPYWDRLSWRDRQQEIRIPSFHIGGWYDGYRDSLPRMLEKAGGPVKAMIGPWSHTFPHDPYPRPGMEWRHEAVRWFDHWLKGVDSGIMDEPRFAVFVREWHPPGPYLAEVPGYWRWEEGWPIARIRQQLLYPQADHGLAAEAPSDAVHQLRNVPTSGMEAGGPVMWWGDVAHDQRPTDAFSLVYDSAPLEADTEILGLPRALLTVAADAKRANWFVRLNDVAPDGTVTQVAGAGFNGTHRNSAREPEDLVPGEFFPLDIEMHFTSWVFPAGHRIRLSVSNAQWPMFWPTPHPLTSSLKLGGAGASRLVLPVVPAIGVGDSAEEPNSGVAGGDMPSATRHKYVPVGSAAASLPPKVAEGISPPAPEDAPAPPDTGSEAAPRSLEGAPRFLPPVEYPGAPGFENLDSGNPSGYGEVSSVDRNPQTGEVTVKATNTGGSRYPWGMETYRETIEHKTSDANPAVASMRGTHLLEIQLPNRKLTFEGELEFSSDAENFYYRYFRRLSENGALLREKTWTETIPRDFQ